MRTAFLCLVLAACGGAPIASSGRAAPLFTFHVGFWVSLHERLYAESLTAPAAGAGAGDAWTAAVAVYRTKFADHSIEGLFSPELNKLRDELSAAGDAPALPASIDPELATALSGAASVYRSKGWSDDRAKSQAWILEAKTLVATHGAALASEHARVLGTPWPSAPIPVWVTGLAGPVGAFTVSDPPRIAVASDDKRVTDDVALETLFHEASHVLAAKVEPGLATAAEAQKKPLPGAAWHLLLFFTTGELVQRRLGPAYVPYAVKQGVYGKAPEGEKIERALRAGWVPYIDGKTTMETAFADVIKAL